jgi:nucleoside-diphosphate-sugar epimerase
LNNGATGIVEFSRTRLLRSTAIIKGAKGILEIDLTHNKIQAHPLSLLSYEFEGIKASKLPAQGYVGLFVAQLKEWLFSIEEKRRPFISGEDSLPSIRLIEQCYNKRKKWSLPWVDVQPRENKGVEIKDHGTLQEKTVLVTGATGFIGGRLVEKLINEYRANVRVLIRDYSRAARIARFSSVKMIRGDLGDYDTLCVAMKDCDFVFHCAFDLMATVEKDVLDIRTLSEACLHSKIQRLIHISTISVYEPLPDGYLTEESPAEPCDFPYADAKLAVEREILQQVRDNSLPAVILQPTIVYGPYSKPWTDGPVNQLLTGTVILPDNGKGLCNAVYVDDVVNAMVLASQAEGVIGKRFLISGPEPISWDTFFQGYALALGLDDGHIQYLSRDEITRRNNNPLSAIRLLMGNPKRIARIAWLRPILFKAKDKLGESAKQLVKKLYALYNKVAPSAIHMPDTQQLFLYAAKCHVRIDTAQKFLGYQPMFDFNRGMDLTAKYVQWSYDNRPHS